MIIGDAFLRIRPDGTAFAPESTKVVEAGLGDVAKKGAQLLGGMFAGAGLIAAAHTGIEELKESATASSNVESVIRATGESAHVTAAQVDELATSQLALTGVDDEVIKQGAAKLLTFRNVQDQVGAGNDIFDRATKASLDLAQVGFGSVESASTMLGKALNDPVKGMTALGRAGVTFSTDQKLAIKSLTDSGDLLGAQKIILDEVSHQVGGAAEAYGKTLPGQMQIAQESLKNTEAVLVGNAAPAMELLANLTTAAANAVAELPGPLRDIASVGVAAGVGIFAIARPLSGLIDIYTTLAAKRAATSGAMVAADTAETTSQDILATANVTTTTSIDGLIVKQGEQAASTAALTGETDTLAGSTVGLRTSMAVTNLPLIGSLAASAGVLGPLAMAFTAVSAVAGAYGLSLLDPGKNTEALDQKTAALGTTLAHLPHDAGASSTAMLKFLDDLRSVDAELDTGRRDTAMFPGDPFHGDEATVKMSDALREAGTNVQGLIFHLRDGQPQFDTWIDGMEVSGQVSENTSMALKTLGGTLEDQARIAAGVARDTGQLTQGQYDYLVAANTASDGTTNWLAVMDAAPAAMAATKSAAFDLRDAIAGDADALDEAKKRFDDYNNALRASVDPLFGVVDANRKMKQAQDDATSASAKVIYLQAVWANAVRDHGRNSIEASNALNDLTKAQDDNAKATEAVGQAALDTNVAAAQLLEQVRLHPETWANATASIKGWQEQGLITEAQAQTLTTQLGQAATGADNLQGRQIGMVLSLDNTQAMKAAIDFQHQIANIPDVLLGDKGPHRATGGPVLGGEEFYGAEGEGFEILTSPGWRRAPTAGGNVLSHQQSLRYLTDRLAGVGAPTSTSGHNGERTVADLGSVRVVESASQSVVMHVSTPDPILTATEAIRQLRSASRRLVPGGRG